MFVINIKLLWQVPEDQPSVGVQSEAPREPVGCES